MWSAAHGAAASVSSGKSTDRAGIAIIGLAGSYAGAGSVEEFWELLREGRQGIVPIPQERWSLEGFYEREMERAIEQGKSYSRWGGFLEGFADF